MSTPNSSRTMASDGVRPRTSPQSQGSTSPLNSPAHHASSPSATHHCSQPQLMQSSNHEQQDQKVKAMFNQIHQAYRATNGLPTRQQVYQFHQQDLRPAAAFSAQVLRKSPSPDVFDIDQDENVPPNNVPAQSAQGGAITNPNSQASFGGHSISQLRIDESNTFPSTPESQLRYSPQSHGRRGGFNLTTSNNGAHSGSDSAVTGKRKPTDYEHLTAAHKNDDHESHFNSDEQPTQGIQDDKQAGDLDHDEYQGEEKDEEEEEEEEVETVDFQPMAEVSKFDVQTELVDKWNDIANSVPIFIQDFHREMLTDAFDISIKVSQILFKKLKEASDDLEEGVKAIRAEEEKQENCRRIITSFSNEMKRAAAVLKQFKDDCNVVHGEQS